MMVYYAIILFILIISIEECTSFPSLASKLLIDPELASSHPFQPPGPNDIRGPCPGLNTAANHGFIARNGITNLAELVQMQQDLYNVGFDLALVLAVLGVAFDGDIITGELSIGRALSAVLGLLKTPTGLDGHNKFEADVSLTRNDYYLADGDDFTFNGTLYAMMHNEAQKNGGLYNNKTMADFRYRRFQQSVAENGQLVFGTQQLLLYGAASFLYELFPNGDDMQPTETVISSFFGAQPTDNGTWIGVPERIPPNWTKRKTPFTLVDVVVDILDLFLAHPVFFGGNTGRPNSYVPDSSKLTLDKQTVNGVICLLYQIILSLVPSEIETLVTDPFAILNFVKAKLDPIFGPLGCPSTSMNPLK